MDWVQQHCDRLRSNLQHVVDGGATAAQRTGGQGLRVPWSWAARSMVETVMRYPSGLTEAVILAELELLWRRDVRGALVPGKLQAYLDAQYAPLSDVIQACVVRHSDQLVTLVEDHSRSVSCDQSPAKVGMYLHQNFKSCLRYAQEAGHDLLAPGRKVRLTGCRLLTGVAAAVSGSGRAGGGEGGRRSPGGGDGLSTLLLTEYLAFVLDHRRSDDIRLAAGAFGQTRVRDTFNENSNHEAFFVVCKVLEIRRPRQHNTSSSGQQPRKRRQTLQTVVLECAARMGAEQQQKQQQQQGRWRPSGRVEAGANGGDGRCDSSGGRETVLLHLWDEQTCLTSLFQKGDGLAVYWPWLAEQQQSGDSIHDDSVPLTGRGTSSQQNSLSSQLPLAGDASGWHFEYGSATALFVLPRESRAQLFSAANGNHDNNNAITNSGTGDATGAKGPIEAMTGSGGGGISSRDRSSTAVRAARERVAEGVGRGRVLHLQDMPVDENGVRDVLQFPRRLCVSDLAPNMSNVSVYGQVVYVVCVPGSSLPAVLPPSRTTTSAAGGGSRNTQPSTSTSSSFLSQLPVKHVMLLQQQQQERQQPSKDSTGFGAANVVELWIRDEGGKARVLCCGRKAAADALRCRLGQYVLACGLRTFAAAFPPPDGEAKRPGGDVIVLCGETDETAREDAAAASTGEGRTGGREKKGDGGGGGGGGGGDNTSRILNTSCLEGLLHCPFLSRHSLLCDRRRAPGPRSSFACKVAVTWVRWSFGGDGLWAFHRRCGTPLPCHYSALGTSADSARHSSRKRPREIRAPGGGGSRTSGAREDVCATCPLCKISVIASRADEAELGYAPLLVALDDGTRCLVAECRSEVVTAALGGINAHVFLQMGQVERKATLDSVIGREIRCVVGGNGAEATADANDVDCFASSGGGDGCSDWGGGDGKIPGRVEFRVERIASANPAADLAHLLSHE
ncbi:unnamed protein product [Pylaiella littoralis]